jgi:cytochrome c oxidase subunit 4
MKKGSEIRMFLIIYLWLMILALISAATAFLPLGAVAIYVAMAIAAAKAALIIWYYMHVRENPPLVWFGAAAGFFWLLIMFMLTLTDYTTRLPNDAARDEVQIERRLTEDN